MERLRVGEKFSWLDLRAEDASVEALPSGGCYGLLSSVKPLLFLTISLSLSLSLYLSLSLFASALFISVLRVADAPLSFPSSC